MTPYIYPGLTSPGQETFKLRVPQGVITPDKIIDHVCGVFQVKKEELLGKSRSRHISDIRCIAIYLVRKLTGMTVKPMGIIFNRDHSVITYSVQKFEELIQCDQSFKAMFSKVKHLAN